MSRRFGRNQKRALRQAAQDAEAKARFETRRAWEAERRLRELELDLASLIPEGSTLYPPQAMPARGNVDPSRRGIEVLARLRRDSFHDLMNYDGPIGYTPRPDPRVLLHELQTTIFTDPNPTKLGLHLRVVHNGDVASYYLSEEAFQHMLPSVLERASQDVARQLLMALVTHKRKRERIPRVVAPNLTEASE